MSKTAAVVLAFVGFIVFSLPMSAQFSKLLPNGNVYGGVSYAQLTDVINRQSYRGFDGSFEALPFDRYPRLGLVADASGFYRHGDYPVTQYNFVAGPRYSFNFGKWRPFVHAMATTCTATTPAPTRTTTAPPPESSGASKPSLPQSLFHQTNWLISESVVKQVVKTGC